MDAKDIFQARLDLAKFHRARWTARQAQEWKLSLSLWAALAAATYYVKIPSLPLWFGVPLLVAHAWFLYCIRISNHADAWKSFHWIREAEALVGEPKSAPDGKETWELGDWKLVLRGAYAFWCQMLITIALLVSWCVVGFQK